MWLFDPCPCRQGVPKEMRRPPPVDGRLPAGAAGAPAGDRRQVRCAVRNDHGLGLQRHGTPRPTHGHTLRLHPSRRALAEDAGAHGCVRWGGGGFGSRDVEFSAGWDAGGRPSGVTALPTPPRAVCPVVPGLDDLSQVLVRNRYQGQRFTHYLEVDVSRLPVDNPGHGVFRIPTTKPLDLAGSLIRSGQGLIP